MMTLGRRLLPSDGRTLWVLGRGDSRRRGLCHRPRLRISRPSLRRRRRWARRRRRRLQLRPRPRRRWLLAEPRLLARHLLRPRPLARARRRPRVRGRRLPLVRRLLARLAHFCAEARALGLPRRRRRLGRRRAPQPPHRRLRPRRQVRRWKERRPRRRGRLRRGLRRLRRRRPRRLPRPPRRLPPPLRPTRHRDRRRRMGPRWGAGHKPRPPLRRRLRAPLLLGRLLLEATPLLVRARLRARQRPRRPRASASMPGGTSGPSRRLVPTGRQRARAPSMVSVRSIVSSATAPSSATYPWSSMSRGLGHTRRCRMT